MNFDMNKGIIIIPSTDFGWLSFELAGDVGICQEELKTAIAEAASAKYPDSYYAHSQDKKSVPDLEITPTDGVITGIDAVIGSHYNELRDKIKGVLGGSATAAYLRHVGNVILPAASETVTAARQFLAIQ